MENLRPWESLLRSDHIFPCFLLENGRRELADCFHSASLVSLTPASLANQATHRENSVTDTRKDSTVQI